jgi:hypothetical protein
MLKAVYVSLCCCPLLLSLPPAAAAAPQGPLQGHAAAEESVLHKRLSGSKHFDPTRSARVSEGEVGAPVSGGTPTAPSPAGSSKLGANGSSKAAAGDVEMGEWHTARLFLCACGWGAGGSRHIDAGRRGEQ